MIGSEPPPLIEPAPGALPVMAVVLVDVGVAAGGLDRAAIKALDVPVTIALDPTRPDAAEAAADYRTAGIEVAILAPDLPEGADADAALDAWRKAVPGAVAVVAGPPLAQALARAGIARVGAEETQVLDAGRDSEAGVGRALERVGAGGATVLLHSWPASVMGLRAWAETERGVTPAPVSGLPR
ncbi:divergent polysaccharide deacetylase family protein [Paenirhodobacter sp.]|uniref:divergent polysaccharide deacetylase family protein n=1 Tax=Paenirhodobacter sp. TaxID=1965326 RepID=UPI003B3FFC90